MSTIRQKKSKDIGKHIICDDKEYEIIDCYHIGNNKCYTGERELSKEKFNNGEPYIAVEHTTIPSRNKYGYKRELI